MLPPFAHEGWQGVRDCTSYGATVLKAGYAPPLDVILPEIDIAGEESLNLNIWSPDPPAESLSAVMVWIHGGAFVNGSGSLATYDGSAFARDGVVCVTLNYRLGADGFLFLDDGISNVGILDQIAALRWIRENIHSFGGDPEKITIAGESAGAMSVATLLSLEQTEGLFRGAILQSGAAAHWLTAGTARSIAHYLAVDLGIEETRAAFINTPIDSLLAATLKLSAEVQALPDPQRFGEIATNTMIFEPVVDGEVIPQAPLQAISQGRGRSVSVLVGTNAQEFNLFIVPAGLYDQITDELIDLVGAGYGLSPESIATYRRVYASEPRGEVFAKIGGDWFFRIPALRLAEARDDQEASTYVYEFQWGSPLFEGKLGACHGIEIPFVFETTESASAMLGGEAPHALAREMHATWVAFVQDLNPGWPRYRTSARTVRLFGGDEALASDPAGETRKLWDGIR
jgi:para-nitrobenzyl esterase